MKRLFFAFLCVLLLCVPILCMSETTEIAYACDTCGNQDICSVIVTGEGEMGGAWGEYYDVVCQCGACLFSSWRQTGPAPAAEPEPPVVPPAEPEYHRPVNNDPPAEPEYIQPVKNDTPTNTGSGDPPAVVVQPQSQTQSQSQSGVKPEEPVTLPSSSGGNSGSSGGGTPAVTVVNAPAQQAQSEALPPVVLGGDAPIQSAQAGGESAVGGQKASSENSEPEKTVSAAGGNGGIYIPQKPKIRNYQKYPVFSIAYPSRRLNMEGDPDAWAHIPGEKIYPVSGASLLTEMLNGGP